MDERVSFVTHQGHQIMLIDASGCTSKELILLLEEVRLTIPLHPPHSLLTLVDVTGAHFDREVATRVKEVLVFDRPFVKRSAWVGTQSLPHVYYENFKSFSKRDIPPFNTREEAMDWLVNEE